MKKFIAAMIVMFLCTAGAVTGSAQGRDYRQNDQAVENDQGGPGGRRGHRGPPEEAIDACADLTEGDDCAFVVPERNLEGTCRSMRRSDEIACMPSHRQ